MTNDDMSLVVLGVFRDVRIGARDQGNEGLGTRIRQKDRISFFL